MNKLLLPILILLLTACTKQPTDLRPTLTVSIEPLRYVVEAVVGNKFQVVTLMPQGASPETYEPTPKQMMELNESQALFCAGTLGFEHTRLPQMAATVCHTQLVSLSNGIKPIIDHSHQHHGLSQDPHIWMTAGNLIKMAENTCSTLCNIDSANTSYYQDRLETFRQEMEKLDAELKTKLRPIENRTFAIYHPALGYFAKTYGLHQLTVEHDGKEPSAAHLKLLVNQCKAEKVSVVFISKEHTGRAAQRLAESINAQKVIINPLDYDVPAQMRLIAQKMNHE